MHEKWLEQRKKQLATATSRYNDVNNDMNTKPLQLPLQLSPLLHKNRWIQVHCLFAHWTNYSRIGQIHYCSKKSLNKVSNVSCQY